MDLKYMVRLSEVEKEYLKSFNNEEFIKAFNTDRYLKIILAVAKEDYIRAATICNIKYVDDLKLEDLIIFIEIGDPYIEKFKK